MADYYSSFDSYDVYYDSPPPGDTDALAAIRLYAQGGEKEAGLLIFQADGVPLPHNWIDSGRAVLYYPLSRFHDVLHVLQFGKPLHIWLLPETGRGRIYTGL